MLSEGICCSKMYIHRSYVYSKYLYASKGINCTVIAFAYSSISLQMLTRLEKWMIIIFDYKPVCSLFVLRPDVPHSCCHPCKRMDAQTARRNPTCSTFSQFRTRAGQCVLGPVLGDPVGTSLRYDRHEVPDRVSGTSSSITTGPALSEDHSWEHRAHQALCTA